MQTEKIAEKVVTILEANPEPISTFYATPDQDEPSKATSSFSNEYVELLLQLESRIHESGAKEFFWQLLGVNFASSVPTITGAGSALARAKIKAVAQVRKHCDCAFMTYLRAGRVDEALGGVCREGSRTTLL